MPKYTYKPLVEDLIVTVLGQRHLLYSATSLIGLPTTSALAHGSISLFISVLATPFPFP
jgi:hypothetical protein